MSEKTNTHTISWKEFQELLSRHPHAYDSMAEEIRKEIDKEILNEIRKNMRNDNNEDKQT